MAKLVILEWLMTTGYGVDFEFSLIFKIVGALGVIPGLRRRANPPSVEGTGGH